MEIFAVLLFAVPAKNPADVLGAIAAVQGDGLYTLLLLLIAVVTWAAYAASVRRKRQARARDELSEAQQTLVAEFPELVRGWGGPAVLKDADSVREILRGLMKSMQLQEAGTSQVESSSSTTTDTPEQTPREAKLLLAIQTLERAQHDLQMAHERGPRGLAWTIIIASLAIGVAGAFGVVGVGVLGAILLGGAVMVTRILAWLSRKAELREAVHNAERTVATEFPEAVWAFGGPDVLSQPEAVRRILTDLNRKPQPFQDMPLGPAS